MKDVPQYIDPEKIVPIARGSTEAFKTGAWSNRRPVHMQKVSPCWTDCPAGNSIPRALFKASQGDMDGALSVFLEETPLPGVCGSVCYHPCELACNRGSWDGAVNIRAVERAASEFGQAQPVILTTEGAGQPVAVVGSGPAGLSAAYHLARMGSPVTLYEAEKELGGLLRWGIPGYRLRPEVLQRDLDRVLSLNIEVKTGVKVDSEALREIRAAHKAVFISIGCGSDVRMGIPGENEEGVFQGVAFLKAFGLGADVRVGRSVAVIGGGNAAMDAARAGLRLGADKVSILYRRTRQEMPAFEEEIEAAIEEGIAIHFLAAPVEVISQNGRTTGLRCIKTRLGEPDSSGRRRAVPIEGSEFVFEADTVISAIGQQADLGAFKADQFAGAISADSPSVSVDSASMETSVAGLFAGGDLVNGPASVVQAIADGKRAAAAIHFRLQGKDFATAEQQAKLGRGPGFSINALFRKREGWDPSSVVKFEDLEPLFLDKRPRGSLPVLDPDLRKRSFDEIAQPLDLKTASSEAARCFFCGTCSACDRCYIFCPDISISDPGADQPGYVANPDYCKGCAICAAVCPRGVMSMSDGQ